LGLVIILIWLLAPPNNNLSMLMVWLQYGVWCGWGVNNIDGEDLVSRPFGVNFIVPLVLHCHHHLPPMLMA
jgi:hypothetical protein